MEADEQELLEAIERIVELGPDGAMREDEQKLGFTLVEVGSVPWFSKDDWSGGVVSIRNKAVRIVAIIAKEQGKGAFGRMITGIGKAGLQPLVIAPLPPMERILRRWGWTSMAFGSGWNRQEVWQPPAGWMEQRLAKSTAISCGQA